MPLYVEGVFGARIIASNPNLIPKDRDVYPTGNIVALTIWRIVELGLRITGAADAGEFTVIDGEVIDLINDTSTVRLPFGKFRDHRVRRFADLPVVGFLTTLHITLPRYLCAKPRVGHQDFFCCLTARMTDRRSLTGSPGYPAAFSYRPDEYRSDR